MLDCNKKNDDAVENKYLFQITNRWTIDGSVRKNIARYINHACRPNAQSDVRKKKRRVDIRAIKDIAPGEEINYDYGTDYFKEYLKPIGCKCDSCEKKRKQLRAEARAEKRAGAARGNKLNGHKALGAARKKSKTSSTASKGRKLVVTMAGRPSPTAQPTRPCALWPSSALIFARSRLMVFRP
jgi:hypothetical protein